MPLGRQFLFFFFEEAKICSTRGFVCSDFFFFSPSGFRILFGTRNVGKMILTIHPHLSVRATDWPLFQLSASNEPSAGRKSGHPPKDPRSPRDLENLRLTAPWLGCNYFGSEGGCVSTAMKWVHKGQFQSARFKDTMNR